MVSAIKDVSRRIQDFLVDHEKPLIVILGPTASGKTQMSLEIAKELGGEIVSADSRQVYRGMDVGTDKVVKAVGEVREWKNGALLVQNIPHHLLDIIEPDEPFSLAQYKLRAEEAVDFIHSRKKIPFLVGGTMLYIDAVVKNLIIPHDEPNRELRAQLEKQSLDDLTKQLRELDPECAREIDAKNPRRVVRALEYCLQTGGKFSQARQTGPVKYSSLLIGLDIPRKELYRRIDERIDSQVERGLVEETKRLADQFGYDIPSMSALGYRQIGMYLRGECSLEEAVQRLKFDTHGYARRQLTWWRKQKKIEWISISV